MSFNISEPKYKFNENIILNEIKSYIDLTYGQHYSNNKFQSMEIIGEMGDAIGFCRGNIIKYIMRLGKKKGWNRDDLLKVIHYSILLMHFSDEYNKENDNKNGEK